MDKVFRFYTRFNLVELLGRQAQEVAALLKGLEEVPDSSIYYHTHRFLQQHHYLSPEPPNDFAFWATNALGLDALGERLASVDTVRYGSLAELREKYIDILKSYRQTNNSRPTFCPEGEEFHFMSCRTFILPTDYEARNLREFCESLNKVSVNSLYFHMFEARLRLERGNSDFANWFGEIGQQDLAREVSRLDPYTMTLEGLRRLIIRLVSRHVQD
jgi:Family of unknown function (DUF5752)